MSQQPHYECKFADKIEDMSKQIDDLHKIFYRGNGVPPMTVRIDRLESDQKRRATIGWLAISAGITALVGVIIDKVARH